VTVTLSDRLERAKTERLLAAGMLHDDAALEQDDPVPAPATNSGISFPDRVTIEVSAAALTTVAPAPTGNSMDRMVTGEDSADCPNCHRPGKVDMVDLVGHTVHLSCSGCGTMWRAPHGVTDPTS
jgi:hypothetical protein